MAVQLRPHHLLCMLTFIGKGYSPAFVANLEQVVRRLATGAEMVQIVAGPDDICAPLLGKDGVADCHCHRSSVIERDRLATEAIGSLLGRAIAPGTELLLSCADLDLLREAFAAGTIRQACTGCQWKPLCDDIAAAGFADTLLRCADLLPATPPSSVLSLKFSYKTWRRSRGSGRRFCAR
jgi:uncharacterized protein